MKAQSMKRWDAEAQLEMRGERSRPFDGIVVGPDAAKQQRHPGAWVRDTWVLAASPEEGLAEFFLEDPLEREATQYDPTTYVCRGIRPDGSIVIGSIRFRDDRFLSEIFSSGEEE